MRPVRAGAAHATTGERWYGFDCVRDLEGVGPDVLMVPLLGHTLGHAGVAVRRDDGWLFYAGDAYLLSWGNGPGETSLYPGCASTSG